MKSKRVLYLVEGETEKVFLTALMLDQKLEHGRVQIFNCWDRKVTSILRSFPRAGFDKIYILFDTDVIQRVDNFIHSVKEIRKVSKRVFLLQQTRHFEDELVYSCSQLNSVDNLFAEFDAQGADKFKREFIRVSNRLERLNRIGLA